MDNKHIGCKTHWMQNKLDEKNILDKKHIGCKTNWMKNTLNKNTLD